MDFKNQKPIYLQIADHICNLILLDKLRENEKIPSVREYAAEMEVNVNTMARTFEWLQNQGVVESRRGLGNYVAEGAKAKIDNVRREEFFTQDLPEIFKTMDTLGISIKEIIARYELRG